MVGGVNSGGRLKFPSIAGGVNTAGHPNFGEFKYWDGFSNLHLRLAKHATTSKQTRKGVASNYGVQ